MPKTSGPRSVVCSQCGKRGVANRKTLEDGKPVVCGDCRAVEREKGE